MKLREFFRSYGATAIMMIATLPALEILLRVVDLSELQRCERTLAQ